MLYRILRTMKVSIGLSAHYERIPPPVTGGGIRGSARNQGSEAFPYPFDQFSALNEGPWLLALSTMPFTDVLYTR
jgi:hypothetical protein